MAARVPPQNLEAEQSILGSLMLDPEAWDQVGDLIEAQDFYKNGHQVLFKAIKELISRSLPVDLITVNNLLAGNGELQSAGGHEYLADLVSRTVSSAHVSVYAKSVKEKSLLRKLIASSTEVLEKAYAEDFITVDHFLDEAEEKFYSLGEQKNSQGLAGPLDLVRESMMKIEELFKQTSDVTGISTGLTNLDRMTSGLHGGELTIIAARPSMGKTAFSLNLAQHMAIKLKKTVAYFSLEMSQQAMMMRILGSEAHINMKEIRSGKLADTAWPKLIHAAGLVSESKLFIDETSGLSPLELRSRSRRLKAQHGLDCIIIDYLQLMKLKEKTESREREVSEISRTLKAIAKELNVPVIALAQLNRGVEGRTEKRPMLSDLRESGSIEQDADVIMMLYRDDYYDKESQEKKGHAEVIIGKQRNGPTGTVRLTFDAEYGRFRDADPEPSHPVPQPLLSPQGPKMMGGKPRNFAPGASS
ncbi:MAG: replicative DNA helicase [Bdellovibrio sp.]